MGEAMGGADPKGRNEQLLNVESGAAGADVLEAADDAAANNLDRTACR